MKTKSKKVEQLPIVSNESQTDPKVQNLTKSNVSDSQQALLKTQAKEQSKAQLPAARLVCLFKPNNRAIIKEELKLLAKERLSQLIRQIALSNLWADQSFNSIEHFKIEKLIAQHFDMSKAIRPQVCKMIETLYIRYMMAQHYKYMSYAFPETFQAKAISLLDAPNLSFPMDAATDFFDTDNINGLNPSIRFVMDVKSYYKQMPHLKADIKCLSLALIKYTSEMSAITLFKNRQNIIATHNQLLIQFYNNSLLGIRFL